MAQVKAGMSGARAQQRMETHERVFQAAIRVLTARGYDGATMEEIAAEAGVARRTAFYHFPAKSDIATEWAIRRGERAFAAIRQSVDPALPDPAASDSARAGPDRVRAYFHELAVMTERDGEETRQLTTGWLRAQGTPGHRPALSAELRDWLDGWLGSQPRGSSPEAIRDPALAAEVLFDVFRGALLRWIPERDPSRGRFTAEADAAVLLVLAGLGYQPEPRG